MIKFKIFFLESANTNPADINEIQLGYFLSDNWKNFVDSSYVKKQLNDKKQKVSQEEFDSQTEKAKSMAEETIKWAKANGYSGKVINVWWTARPGVLAKAVKQAVESRKNPTDILIQFSDNEFLGLSAKSTKKMGDIGFKNPGLGTIEKKLGIDMSSPGKQAVENLRKQYKDLSSSAAKRKKEIRADDEIKITAEKLGKRVLMDIRDIMFIKMSNMKQEDLLKFVLNDWLDAAGQFPRYIKITGFKKGSKVEDPLENSKITNLSNNDIKLQKVGNDSIGILAGNHKIMKMRVKYESQKLAGSIKFSGDPWK